MKDFLLNKKWVGFFALLIYALIVAVFVSKSSKEAVLRYGPTVAAEIEYFLPITVENGEIVEVGSSEMKYCPLSAKPMAKAGNRPMWC